MYMCVRDTEEYRDWRGPLAQKGIPNKDRFSARLGNVHSMTAKPNVLLLSGVFVME